MSAYYFHFCEWIVLAIFTAVLLVNVKIVYNTVKNCRKGIKNNVYANYIEYLSIFIILQVVAYMVLQVNWIVEEQGEKLPEMIDGLWLAYDYIAGLVLLCISISIDSLTKLKIKAYK